MHREAIYILKRPLVTEKSTWESNSRNRISFEVDLHARKHEIKSAVEEMYKVRVVDVATQVRKGKFKRTKFGETRTADWKKAVVQLHADDRIDLF
jgi:large subunit ribosomal protein L23